MRPNKTAHNLLDLKLSAPEAGVMEFSGYGSVFGNVDSYGDTIQKGAFSAFLEDVKSGKQQYPAMLLQHGGLGINATDMTPIGIWTDIAEDDIGLKLSGKFADTQNGIEAYKLMKMQPRPAITGLSIGFYTRSATMGSKQDAYDRLLTQIDVVEISLVTFPANDKARVTDIKSHNDFTERDFERLMRDAGFSRSEAIEVINHGFKSLKTKRDAGNEKLNEELKRMALAIERNTKIFTT